MVPGLGPCGANQAAPKPNRQPSPTRAWWSSTPFWLWPVWHGKGSATPMQVVATRAPVCLWGSSQQTCARRTTATHTCGNFSARKHARRMKARHQGGLQAHRWCLELRMLAPRRYSSSCVLNMPTTCLGLSSRPSKTCLPTRLHPAHALTGAPFISTVTGQCARHGGMPLLSVSKLQSIYP